MLTNKGDHAVNDRQFLQSLLKICAMNIQNEEFEQMYIMIFEHLNPSE